MDRTVKRTSRFRKKVVLEVSKRRVGGENHPPNEKVQGDKSDFSLGKPFPWKVMSDYS